MPLRIGFKRKPSLLGEFYLPNRLLGWRWQPRALKRLWFDGTRLWWYWLSWWKTTTPKSLSWWERRKSKRFVFVGIRKEPYACGLQANVWYTIRLQNDSRANKCFGVLELGEEHEDCVALDFA